ncbi:YceI family protein [Nocardia brasiliensis]|uniref:YceI family protein n=1 Tax=Nocardia brasiliensis TaxID=37326 RepID=UPI003D8C63E6
MQQHGIGALSAGTWAIDPHRSTVGVLFHDLRTTMVYGNFGEFAGELIIDDDGTASIWAEIRLDSMVTGNEFLDARLRSRSLLGVGEPPTAVFISQAFRAGAGPVVVPGKLLVQEISKPVTVEIVPIGRRCGGHAYSAADVGVTSVVSRAGLGVKGVAPMPGDATGHDEITLIAAITLTPASMPIAM